MSVVEVKALEKTFVRGFFRKRTAAVRGVSFEVERGEIFGFLGPNGAGKTTTIKMLMGLIHPTGGSAKVLGDPIGAVRAKRKIGYLPENPYFYDYLSALEFLHMVGRLFGLDAKTRERRANELLDRVGLSMAKSRSMRSYSKGMMQRVGLAQALMGDPELVVMDEPMSGLDPIGRKEVRDLLLELRDAGKTVFFCTHILADASMLCDRVGIIVKGELKDVGSLDSLLGGHVQHVEIHAQGEAALRTKLAPKVEELGGKLLDRGEGFGVELASTQQADAIVAAIIEGGGRIHELRPHTMTLEELFVRESGTKAEEMRS